MAQGIEIQPHGKQGTLSYSINTMVADDLEARSSAAVVLKVILEYSGFSTTRVHNLSDNVWGASVVCL